MGDPVEIFAGVVALSELCALRFPRMRDARDKVLSQLQSECEIHDDGGPTGCHIDMAHLQAMPGFSKALETSRAWAKALPTKDVNDRCGNMYSSFAK